MRRGAAIAAGRLLTSTVRGSLSCSSGASSTLVATPTALARVLGSGDRIGFLPAAARGAAGAAAPPPKGAGKRPVDSDKADEKADAASAPAGGDCITDATPEHAGRFWVLTEKAAGTLLPEGCPAMEAEFKDSGARRLLLREAFFRLQDRLVGAGGAASAAAASPATPCTVLVGPAGCGKSVMLAMAVAWARSHGWLALYIPQGRLYTERSQFARSDHPGGGWDTPDHARDLLSALAAAHGELLRALPRQLGGGGGAAGGAAGKLMALAEAGLAPSATGAAAVEAALAMLAELRACTAVPVLIAVDEVNALSGWSEYHEVVGPKYSRRLPAGELRIARSLRDGSLPLARGACLFASSESIGISPRLRTLDIPTGVRRALEPFSQAETEAMLRHWAAAGLAGASLSEETLPAAALRLRAVSSGSGAVMRRECVVQEFAGW